MTTHEHGGERNGPGRKPRNTDPDPSFSIAEVMADTTRYAVGNSRNDTLYHYEAGIWREFPNSQTFGVHANNFYENNQSALDVVITSDVRRSMFDTMTGYCGEFGLRLYKPRANTLPMKNGCLDYVEGPEHGFVLRPYDRADYHTSQLDYEYNPELPGPPVAWKFIQDIASGDNDFARWLWQVIARLILLPNDDQEIYLLTGKTGSGKGTLLRLIQDLLGGQAANISQNDMNERFGFSALHSYPKVIGMDDIKSFKFPVDKLKRITGGLPLRVEQKNKDSFEVDYKPHVVMTGNEAPTVRDVGFRRRLVVIPFERSITDYQQEDKKLPSKLRAERSAILNYLVEILEAKAFTETPEKVRLNNEDVGLRGDSFATWHSMYITETDAEDEAMTYVELFKHYESKTSEKELISMVQFRRKWDSVMPRKGKRGRAHILYVTTLEDLD